MAGTLSKYGEELKILPEKDFFAECAKIISESINGVLSSSGKGSIALSGGSTPLKLFDELASYYSNSVEWKKVHFFWSDERAVPPDSNDSNFKMAQDHLLSKINIPRINIHRIKGELSPEDAAADYEKEIRSYFNGEQTGFDIILLGLGKDGHTASLFPGTDAVNEKIKNVTEVFSNAKPNWRITLTFPMINASKEIYVIVSGKDKAGIISDVLDKHASGLPISIVKPIYGKLTWLLDSAAAEKIKSF